MEDGDCDVQPDDVQLQTLGDAVEQAIKDELSGRETPPQPPPLQRPGPFLNSTAAPPLENLPGEAPPQGVEPEEVLLDLDAAALEAAQIAADLMGDSFTWPEEDGLPSVDPQVDPAGVTVEEGPSGQDFSLHGPPPELAEMDTEEHTMGVALNSDTYLSSENANQRGLASSECPEALKGRLDQRTYTAEDLLESLMQELPSIAGGEANASCHLSPPTINHTEQVAQLSLLPSPYEQKPASCLEEEHVEVKGSTKRRKGKGKGKATEQQQQLQPLSLEMERRQAELARLRAERQVAKQAAVLRCLREVREEERVGAPPELAQPPQVATAPTRPVGTTEVVLCIEFRSQAVKGKPTLQTQEWLVLGSQPLTALRDNVQCKADDIALANNIKAPSAYIFIEDVFYNDMRSPQAIDYSRPIIEWGAAQDAPSWRGIPQMASRSSTGVRYEAKLMQEAHFEDLAVQVDKEYLYCHQGNCEHTFVFTDIRLVNVADVQDYSRYPVLRYKTKTPRKTCTICNLRAPQKFTYGSRLAPEDPCYFCDKCYHMLHYGADKKILYDDFEVFKYYDP